MMIELFDDPSYTIGADNINAYSLYYFTDGPQDSTGSFHGIRVIKDGLELNSCLLLGSGGTTIHETSAVVDGNSLLVCCGDSVFSLDLPGLELKWQKHVDLVACFQIYNIEGHYFVHGELEVSKLDAMGEVLWSFSGCDIFVSQDNEACFAIQGDRILLVDWERNRYELDFNGKVLYSSAEI